MPDSPSPGSTASQQAPQTVPRGAGGLPAYPRQTAAGYYGPRHSGPNGNAVWSFVLGLAGAIPGGLVFGGIALSQIRDTGQSGTWLAVSGMVLSVLWIPVVVVALMGWKV
ncbi:DUF4190 domain-containing protein [Kitasatospora paranensis]|uniref:DUF4190 domain-containing protein n=1 Tax=Kitasatospora paranensis TaxID=258053 RepID=A0ABW2FYL4_9ACTN